jgi:hypothetical protein
MAVDKLAGSWENAQSVPAHGYVCGFCEHQVAPNRGLDAKKGGAVYGRVRRLARDCTTGTVRPDDIALQAAALEEVVS